MVFVQPPPRRGGPFSNINYSQIIRYTIPALLILALVTWPFDRSKSSSTTSSWRLGIKSKSSELTHEVPDWYHDAKLGIFIHWGLFSVPAWAETELDFGDTDKEKKEQTEKEKWNHWFKHNSYAEWYYNTYRIENSPTQIYHHKTYGTNYPYENFVKTFNDNINNWDPNTMANLFNDVHARYVVLTTKHHDGFLLWPSKTLNPNKPDYHSKRDIVGELGTAVRKHKNMRMGYYYSGGVDWSFNDHLVLSKDDLHSDCFQEDTYVDYANAHWKELIDKYNTSILWNDICYPQNTNVEKELFQYFYEKNPEGIINDRFGQYRKQGFGGKKMIRHNVHRDIVTPEYKSFHTIQSQKWESCRGIGHSFGYNIMETPEHYLSVKELVRSFVDIVSKNGNLLLNVGPMANGTIPPLQEERLRGLGQWLDGNGEAIFNTRPWKHAEGKSPLEVRFTKGNNALYVIAWDPKAMYDDIVVVQPNKQTKKEKIEYNGSNAPMRRLKLEGLTLEPNKTKISLLNGDNDKDGKKKKKRKKNDDDGQYLDFEVKDDNTVHIALPYTVKRNTPAFAIKITPLPTT